VLIAGGVFGALHISGGRNVAFAAWASAVGLVYGWAFLATQDMFVPMAAHSLANLASGAVWLSENKGGRLL
jgi:membrane protease YdiL (CAAX protease family)